MLPKSKGGATVLAYHLVGGGTGSPVDISVDCFRSQIQRLVAERRVVTEWGQAVDGAVVLTFDDAYENFYKVVWPILRDAGVSAILYVPCTFVGGSGAAPIVGTESLSACTWAQLREMAADGLVLGSHSVSHRNLMRLPLSEAIDEIATSRKIIEDMTGSDAETFCYPQGKWGLWLEKVVRNNYASAVVGGGWKYRRGVTSDYRIPRISVRRDMSADLSSVLRGPVCIEEFISDAVRRLDRAWCTPVSRRIYES